MRHFYLSLLAMIVAFCAFNVHAQDVEISISPAPGEYETLPTVFTITYSGDGLKSVTKNIAGGSTMLITSPGEAPNQQITGVFTTNSTTITCTIPSSSQMPLDKEGDYTVQLRAKAVAYNWTDGTKTYCPVTEFTYTVKGTGGDEPEPEPVPEPVVYDIEMNKTTPALNPLDLTEYDKANEILQIYFNMGGLQLGAAGANVTITGPEYNQTSSLQYLMGMPTATVFKTAFTAPTYSGKYTLTIPQGVIGDEDWIKDPEYGHANAEVVYEFEVVGGQSTATATVSISPLPGEYDTLPEEFVITVDGPKSIARNLTGGNPLLIISPKNNRQQVTGTFSGNTIVCKVPATFSREESGDYTVQFKEGSVTYVWEDDSKSLSTGEEYIYSVKGIEEENPNEPKEVAYDIEMNKTVPNLRPLDLGMYGLETLQIYFDMPGLQIAPDADAVVTITGPNYYSSTKLAPNMNMTTATVFKAAFNDPKYSGDYTLTIPQGVIGDETWIKDRTMGHANAEVVYGFTVTGGEDPSTITRDLTFNPRVTPSSGSKVSDLSAITLAFNSTPYWDAEAEIEVYYRADLSESGTDVLFGNATLSKGTTDNLILTINPTPRSVGQYSLTLPEGVIWNEAHEADEEAGALNGEAAYSWFLTVKETNLQVTGHVPATDAYVGCFPAGSECIVIKTNVTGEVASADIELIEYKLNDDTAAPKTLVSATTTDINADGYICWINDTGEDIDLLSGYYYEVAFTLKDAGGSTLTSDMFEFYGDLSVGVEGISADTLSGKIFNLHGVEVKGGKLPAGIYIKDGKKLVIR